MTDTTNFEVKLTSFGNGDISFRRSNDKDSSAVDATPRHYATSFQISFDFTIGNLTASNVMCCNGLVLADRDDAPYRSIEHAAAQQIAPMLRALADQIEQKVAEFSERLAARIPATE